MLVRLWLRSRRTGSLAFERTGEPDQRHFGEPAILRTFGILPENLDELRKHALDGQPQKTVEVPEALAALHEAQIPNDAARAVTHPDEPAALEVASDSHRWRMQDRSHPSIRTGRLSTVRIGSPAVDSCTAWPMVLPVCFV